MKLSNTYRTSWYVASGDLKVELLHADASFSNAFYAEEYVTLVQPHDLDLLWPMRLRIERDEDAFVVSDDLTGVYAEGETQEAAIVEYRKALSGLRRVLAAREHELEPELKARLAVLQSIVPPGD
jgi:predicted RNase H-like HicB family nuclease